VPKIKDPLEATTVDIWDHPQELSTLNKDKICLMTPNQHREELHVKVQSDHAFKKNMSIGHLS
jgi:hypothetical protein